MAVALQICKEKKHMQRERKLKILPIGQMSHKQNPGWLGYIVDYTMYPVIYRAYNKPL